jgi:hypothetical protein
MEREEQVEYKNGRSSRRACDVDDEFDEFGRRRKSKGKNTEPSRDRLPVERERSPERTKEADPFRKGPQQDFEEEEEESGSDDERLKDWDDIITGNENIEHLVRKNK